MTTQDADDKPAAGAVMSPGRIGALAILPVFFKLNGKRAVVIGGNEQALWKAELLAASGALVEVYAETLAEGFDDLAASPPAGAIKLHPRAWQPGDLDGAAIAVAAISDNAEAAAFAKMARAAGVPVNVIDRPDVCDFQFGAIVNRSPLVVAVTTDGAAPVLGQSIRSLIESLLPEGLARWVTAGKAWRRQGERLGATPVERRRFWERFASLALRDAARAPTEADLEALTRPPGEGGPSAGVAGPSVTIIVIGADGGSETLTLGAVRALRGADTIFYDAGLPTDVLGFARREAERRAIPSPSSDEQVSRDEIANVVASASEGGRVVRVKVVSGGVGPASVAREVEALRAAGVVVDTVECGGVVRAVGFD